MARPRTRDRDLPPRMYRKNGAYYYVTHQNKWIRLSDNLEEAKRRWVEIEAPCRLPTQGMLAVFNRYAVEVLPKKSKSTRDEQNRQIKLLEAAFGDFRPDEIKPLHIAQYLDTRAEQGGAVSGNREKALLSHVFTQAMRWGIIDTNPCRGVTRNRERPRDRYVEDGELARFLEFCRTLKHGMLADRKGKPPVMTEGKAYAGNLMSGEVVATALEIAYLAAQRQQDVLQLTLDSIREDGLFIQQLKGKDRKPVKVLVGWAPRLSEAVGRAQKLSRPKGSRYLFVSSRTGQPYTPSGFKSLVQKIQRAWESAGNERFHFHDVRAKGTTDLLDQGVDAKNTTGHANDAIVHAVYDRRAVRKGVAVK
ncbi:integrase [Chitinivorax tropicus]|uniref:Integrase n=1 Tax=Chitinivorax tropicus TaxID=714531 RepID=A0A840MJX2_9PROT|nr:tyrosine-type recombinase/integrase [Chitinivorax tropicus]MBB5017795.1 integrase [Chitinivorax tropicus]